MSLALCRVPVDSPQRFRVEVLFSPGASHNPCQVLPIKQDHTLPVQPRAPLHRGESAAYIKTTLPRCCIQQWICIPPFWLGRRRKRGFLILTASFNCTWKRLSFGSAGPKRILEIFPSRASSKSPSAVMDDPMPLAINIAGFPGLLIDGNCYNLEV